MSLDRILLAAGSVVLATSFMFAAEPNNTTTKNKRASRANAPVEIKIVPVGPTQEIIDELNPENSTIPTPARQLT